MRYARLRHNAAVEDIDYRTSRGLDRALFQKLAQGGWIKEQQNLIIVGPSGVGKSWLACAPWLACALGHRACRDNLSVLYQRIPRLFSDLALARGDGRYARLMRALGGVKLLILDDWGLEPLTAEQRHDLLEIVEDRYGPWRYLDHQPGSCGPLARPDRRPDPRRRNPRSRRSQRPPHPAAR